MSVLTLETFHGFNARIDGSMCPSPSPNSSTLVALVNLAQAKSTMMIFLSTLPMQIPCVHL